MPGMPNVNDWTLSYSAESEKSEAEAPTDRKPDAAQEDKVKAAGSAATKEAKADVKEVKEGQEGV